MEPPPDEVKAGAPDWMVTFADLMSLLLTFFVLLLSFSNMEIVKFRTMAGSVKNALGLKSEIALSDVPTGDQLLPIKNPKEGDGQEDPTETIQRRMVTQTAVAKLRQVIEESEMESEAEVKVTERGVVLELNGDLLFASGKAELNPAARPILDGVVHFVATLPGKIDVEGHTDNVPIATAVFPSNWELSAARAGRAVRYLTERGVPPARLRAVGHSDAVPLDTNDTADGRARNRRVEFLFLATADEITSEELGSINPDLGSYSKPKR